MSGTTELTALEQASQGGERTVSLAQALLARSAAELIADLRDDSLLWDALSTGDGPSGEAVRTVFT